MHGSRLQALNLLLVLCDYEQPPGRPETADFAVPAMAQAVPVWCREQNAFAGYAIASALVERIDICIQGFEFDCAQNIIRVPGIVLFQGCPPFQREGHGVGVRFFGIQVIEIIFAGFEIFRAVVFFSFICKKFMLFVIGTGDIKLIV